MDKNKIIEGAQNIAESISNNRYLKPISKGMVMTIPATMTGAMCTLVGNIGIESYQNFLVSTGLKSLLQLPGLFTTNILSLIVVYFVSFYFVKSFKIDGMVPGILSIICFLIITPAGNAKLADGNALSYISYDWIGSKGMFVALIVGLLVGKLYSLFILNNITIHMPKSVPSFVEKSFASLIPFFCISLIFTIFSWLISLTSFNNIHNIVYSFLQLPFQAIGGSLGGVLATYVFVNVLWWFGLHGKAIGFIALYPILLASGADNLAATNAGTVPPHIFDLGFTTIFMEIGGGGCILGLAILFAFTAKSRRYRDVGRITFVPTFFGINEPITFGTPIVLNPSFFIPTVVTPLVTGLLGYFSIITGLIPRMTGASLPTGIPTFFNAFILAGWRGLIVQIVAVVVSVMIYYPFFRKVDRDEYKAEQELLNEENAETAAEAV